jgi:hypothetical protein
LREAAVPGWVLVVVVVFSFFCGLLFQAIGKGEKELEEKEEGFGFFFFFSLLTFFVSVNN